MKKLSIIFGIFIFISTCIIYFNVNNSSSYPFVLFIIVIVSTIIMIVITLCYFIICAVRSLCKTKNFDKKTIIPFANVMIASILSFSLSNIIIDIQDNNQMKLREECVSTIINDDEILSNSTYVLPEKYVSTSTTGLIEIINKEEFLIIYFSTETGGATTEKQGVGFIQGENYEEYISDVFELEQMKNYIDWYRFNSTLK